MYTDSNFLHRRRPVWIALSDLWLDNEIDEMWVHQIAEIIQISKFTEDEIDDIFVYELAPFLFTNLMVPAGVWSGFDPDWVCEKAMKRIGSRNVIWKLFDRFGISTSGSREVFEQVKNIAFRAKN